MPYSSTSITTTGFCFRAISSFRSERVRLNTFPAFLVHDSFRADSAPLSYPRRHRSRCLGVAIFYSSKHFEKMSELRVVFSEEARGLRGDSDRERAGSGGMTGSPEAVARVGKKAVPDDQFLRRVYGGDTGTGGPAGRANPATASRLEQDLENKQDAAAMVRLRVKGHDDHGGGGGSANGDEEKERAVTVVCAHLFYDPKRPDLKTAQCQMLFQAIHRFHEKCGVSQADGELSSLGVANLILCADFNSKPVTDPSFLPGPLKVSAINYRGS